MNQNRMPTAMVLGHRRYQDLGYLRPLVGGHNLAWSFREDEHQQPKELEEGDLLISLGSLWSPSDTSSTIMAEIRIMERALVRGAFVLGCCFGGQLLATVFGRPPKKRKRAQLGFFPVEVKETGLTTECFFWNEYAFGCPADGEVMAGTEDLATIVKFPRALAVQPHVEASGQMLEDWMGESGGYFRSNGVDPDEITRRASALEIDRRAFAAALYSSVGLR